jgi:hypothetical protein
MAKLLHVLLQGLSRLDAARCSIPQPRTQRPAEAPAPKQKVSQLRPHAVPLPKVAGHRRHKPSAANGLLPKFDDDNTRSNHAECMMFHGFLFHYATASE